jgi:nitrogen fixation NifU-like protein
MAESPNAPYSPRVLEQFQNGRNGGELPDANVRVRAENPACGDILELALKVEGERIVNAKFRARGCVAAIACAAQLVDLIRGRTLAEAGALKCAELVAALGGLPHASSHASHLAMDALAAALKTLPYGK